MTTLLAARLQMTISLVFHIVFAAIGIGLPLMLVLIERRYLRTGDPAYKALARKWAKATGLLFAVGAISGTALSLELGLLWPKYMEVTGAVVGTFFGLEGFAFFIEAIFIGLYLYGWDRLSPHTHWLCGIAIAISGAVSGVLILGVNAWMQLPIGFEMHDGRILVSDPVAIFRRPGWLYMALHSTLACYMAVGFAISAIYAWGWLKGRHDRYHRAGILTGIAVGGIAAILQPLSGDLLAKFVFRTQKAKFAAMEGQFKTQSYAPLRIGGIPEPGTLQTRYAIEIPGGLSFLATHHPSATVPGLDSIPRENWPPVEATHLSFQAMVAIGSLLVLLTIWFWLAWWRKRDGALSRVPAAPPSSEAESQRNSTWLARALVLAGPLGFIALEFGWVVTEVGRQPWVLQPQGSFPGLRVADSVTPAAGVQAIFYAFLVLYVILGVTTVILLRRLSGPPAAAARVLAPQEVTPV